MEYETSYDIGAKPFKHDRNRGNWESSKDFLYACVGHAFRADIVMVLPLVVFETIGIYALIPYIAILAVCVVPIVFIQSFLGQFSGTGFISAFRIAPLFKGIGYVSLIVNFVNLTYYSVLSAIPLFYFFHCLRPTIPWSCEGASQWMDTKELICTKDPAFTSKNPAVEFLRNHFHLTSGWTKGTYFSVQIMMCTIIVWIILTFVLCKSTEFIGRFMRYSCLALIAIMSLCLLRFIFLPGAIDGFWKLFETDRKPEQSLYISFLIPILVFSTLGPGWGSILTMASYNNFKTNIYRYSWFIALAQLGVIIGMACLLIFLKHFMQNIGIGKPSTHEGEWTEFLALPFGLTYLEWPNFWSLLFICIIGLASFNLLVIQLFSLLTSLFDEFENLREIKSIVIFGIVAVLSTTSMLFCSNHGLYFFETLAKLSTVTQVVLNLLLLLVVLWVYGRERFQRDVNFMISQIYPTWMVFVVRFVAPIFLLIGLVVGFFLTFLSMIFHHDAPSSSMIQIVIALFFFLTLWCLIPCYCIIKIKETAGKFGIRLKRCIRPTDWYPVDPVYKQSYEERFSSTDISHPLTIFTEE